MGVHKLYAQMEITAKEYKSVFQTLANTNVHIIKMYRISESASNEYNCEHMRINML